MRKLDTNEIDIVETNF